MVLLIFYVIFMVIGDLLDFAIGAAVSKYWSETASLPVFLACYFFTLWLAWVLALKVTETFFPQAPTPAPAR